MQFFIQFLFISNTILTRHSVTQSLVQHQHKTDTTVLHRLLYVYALSTSPLHNARCWKLCYSTASGIVTLPVNLCSSSPIQMIQNWHGWCPNLEAFNYVGIMCASYLCTRCCFLSLSVSVLWVHSWMHFISDGIPTPLPLLVPVPSTLASDLQVNISGYNSDWVATLKSPETYKRNLSANARHSTTSKYCSAVKKSKNLYISWWMIISEIINRDDC